MKRSSEPIVYCVVPVHNRLEVTRRFIEQIRRQNYPWVCPVIVDDGSTDGTGEFLQSLGDAGVKVLHGDGSLWWGGAMNLGLAYVYGIAADSDYLLMLNDDVTINESYISTLVRESQRNPGTVIGSSQKDELSGAPLWSSYQIHYGSMRFRGMLPVDSAVSAADALPGRGVLFPIYVARAAKFIHRLLPHYLGDLEFTARIKEMGNALLVSNDAEVRSSSTSLGASIPRRKVAARWISTRSPHNIGHRVIFFFMSWSSPIQGSPQSPAI